MASFSKERKSTESPLRTVVFSFHVILASDSPAGRETLASAPTGVRRFRIPTKKKTREKAALEQPKTAMQVAVEAGKAGIDSVAMVEAATAVEAAEISSVVVAEAVVAETVAVVHAVDAATTVYMMAEIIAAAVQTRLSLFPKPRS